MTDNKIGPNIRPVQEPRPQDKPARKERGPAAQEFDKSLQQAMQELNKLNQQPATPAAGNARAILDAAAAEQARFESAMREADRLRQLHQNITQKPAQDKE